MKKNDTVDRFYTALSKGDWKLMHNLYSKDVVYNDELYKNLNYLEVTSMWESLIKRCTNMSVTYKINFEDEKYAEVRWALVYSFGLKKRRVVISCLSAISLLNGKIVRHTESFDFKKWAQQAFGLKGRIMAKNSKFIEKVINAAAEQLQAFINQKAEENNNLEEQEIIEKKPKKQKVA